MKAKLAAWLWAVIVEPLRDCIGVWFGISSETRAKQHQEIKDILSRIEAKIDAQITFQQFEAVNFAVERLLMDHQCLEALDEQGRVQNCKDWAYTYFTMNGWKPPLDTHLTSMVEEKLRQARGRKVGPRQ